MKRHLVWAGLGLLLGAVLYSPAAAQVLTYAQQLVVLEQANRAFEQASTSTDPQTARSQYQQAMAGYEQLIAAEVHNAKLYYNLGNTYFRLNDIGQAIVQYRRGLRLEPGNRQLQANLRYARSRRMDHIEASSQRALLRQLLFWQDDLGLQAQWALALLGYLLAWGGAFALLRWRQPSLRWGAVGAALCCLVFAGSSFMIHTQHTAQRAGVIIADEVIARKGNGDSYAPQFQQPLHAGTEFTVLEERGFWLAIQLENGTSGWIRRESAALL